MPSRMSIFWICLTLRRPFSKRSWKHASLPRSEMSCWALGYGFAFIGNQYRIRANDTDYYVDLLFSHRRLNSLVAVELKVGRFKPEYAGKMNFYLNLLDDFVREPHENPSIGIILCTERNYFEVEYALRGPDKPVGVSEYVLTDELPSSLKDKLPGAEQLRTRIQRELGEMDLPEIAS